MTKVEVISKDTVKPSSPTPPHLRRYDLSFLDQISPPIYMPLLLFFSSGGGAAAAAKLAGIKRSLSEALTRFYPLAGRVRDNDFIDCDDDGVSFTTARANNCLHELLREDPVVADLDELLPCKPDDDVDVGDSSALLVRATVFDCGGMVIGLCFSHKAGDASSLVMFLHTWTAISVAAAVVDHEDDRYIPTPPQFESAALFPAKSLSGFKSRTGIIKESIVTKRFVFDAPTIEALRKRSSVQQIKQQQQRCPTRVEALSAFIWTRFMTATTTTAVLERDRELEEKLYMVQHTVNIRRRMDPPLPDNSFGNYYRIAVATLSSAAKSSYTAKEGFNGIVREMRDAIEKIDGEYVRRVREGDEHLKFVKERAERATKGKFESFTFSSLCRFPLYESDFGWGKPIWVASAGMPFRNLVSFFDSRSGNGIEAWINLKEEDMVRLEGDREFMAMVSSPPLTKLTHSVVVV